MRLAVVKRRLLESVAIDNELLYATTRLEDIE